MIHNLICIVSESSDIVPRGPWRFMGECMGNLALALVEGQKGRFANLLDPEDPQEL